MNEPILVIMAAGMGSRYGGLKQIDPIDQEGHLIIDFSIFDAVRAGFKKVVFIIKKEIEADFKEMIGNRISQFVDVSYVYQELDTLPEGYTLPEGRIKPWGTAHAILCCLETVDAPFAVINADDYYGKDAFTAIYNYLLNAKDDDYYRYAMVGYVLENTLTENGSVARGICVVDSNNMLTNITERTRIEKTTTGAAFTEDDRVTWVNIAPDSIVSMNMWGFTPSILKETKARFSSFLDASLPVNPLKCEYFLPSVVSELLTENKATVSVLTSTDRWYGVTYKEDKETVVHAIECFKNNHIYPAHLWEEK
ncbi:MAG: nucleotidyltransferase [Clostridiales bacterium]|nr:nucleotidyltransferase [Clostridiales bacterium]